MPFTPFHFGPGVILHALAPRQISFLSFCAANILIDLESLYNLANDQYPVHAFFHTYLGATLVIACVIVLFIGCRWLTQRFWLPNFLSWRELSLLQVSSGAFLGAYSHIALDSIMHADIQPLSPFSTENVLLSLVSLSALHIFCVAVGVLGILGLAIRRMLKNRSED